MADLLRHEAGFANFPNRLDKYFCLLLFKDKDNFLNRLDSADLLLTENIKQNSIGKVNTKF